MNFVEEKVILVKILLFRKWLYCQHVQLVQKLNLYSRPSSLEPSADAIGMVWTLKL